MTGSWGRSWRACMRRARLRAASLGGRGCTATFGRRGIGCASARTPAGRRRSRRPGPTHFRRPPERPPLATFLACSMSSGGSCLDGRLKVVHADGEARRNGSLEDAIGALVDEALETRAVRRAEKAGDRASLFLDGMAESDRGNILPSDMKGLVGEIVAEAVLVECGFGDPLYSKWRHVGTSASKGIDIIMRKGDLLLAVESKHLHALRRGRNHSSEIARKITTAFGQSCDLHTRYWLSWLRRHLTASARLGHAVGASRPDPRAMNRTAKIIDKALSDWSVSANAVVVFDARHGVDAKSIEMHLGPGTLSGIQNPAVAVVSRIGGICEVTTHLIGRHC